MEKADAPTTDGVVIASQFFDGPQVKGESRAKLKQVVEAARDMKRLAFDEPGAEGFIEQGKVLAAELEVEVAVARHDVERLAAELGLDQRNPELGACR